MIFGLRIWRGLVIFNDIFRYQYDLVFPFFVDFHEYFPGFASENCSFNSINQLWKVMLKIMTDITFPNG